MGGRERFSGVFFGLVALLFAISTLATAKQTVTASPSMVSPHPMLFFSVEDLPALRAKAVTTHVAITKLIVNAMETVKKDPESYLPPTDHKEFTSKWNEEFGNDLSALAMYCVLFPEDSEALAITHEFMERMTKQSSWEFTDMSKDEMPMSHSLVGMATAYDFLYPTFTVDQRRRHFNRIRKTTARHFERFKEAAWGFLHLQNHVWNNCVGLLIGAIVTGEHDPRVEEWVGLVAHHLNTSLNIQQLNVDGSLDEGVAYSTYTTRSMTMFIYLLDRHYGIKLYDNYWLQQYFQFIYRTLIGYKENVGIGDASATWFYGPESILVFLDRFILRNGYGNWLAARIRENRVLGPLYSSILAPRGAQRWSTYFTEFIWYDPELGERNPDPSGEPVLTLFSDWGVVTYGGGLPPHNTFFSFKSGYMHGRAINTLVNQRIAFKKDVESWWTFNPGHEHPDQNSFIFFPRGHSFITEAYYGPKYTFLNNVLMFAPSQGKCFPRHYVGQVGECHKWLYWLSSEAAHTWADIVAAYKELDYAFTSGEAVGWYREDLRLESVYRSLFLLTPDVLLVVDHVQLKPGSKLDRANAFFNMRQGELSLNDNFATFPDEAVLKHSNQEFHATWKAANNAKTAASIAGYEYPCEYKTRESQLINISVSLDKQQPTRIAYVFYHGASPKPSLPQFIQTSDIGFKLAISIDEKNYELSVATQHSNPVQRLNWLGHTGFASLSTSTGQFLSFGSQSTPPRPNGDIPSLPTVFISSMKWSGAELMAGALMKSPDFSVTSLANLLHLNKVTSTRSGIDPCDWKAEDRSSAIFPQWLYDLYSTPYTSVQDISTTVPTEFVLKPNARVVVVSNDGQMDSKLGFFPMQKSTKIVHILRDPRSWVAYVMKYGKYSEVLEQIVNGLKHAKCPKTKTLPPFQKLNQLVQQGNPNPVEVLSQYWMAHIAAIINSGINNLLIVSLEEIISKPEKTAEVVFQFLGMPLPPASRHHLLQYTRSKVFELDSGEIIDYQNMNWWEDVLSIRDRQTVETNTHEITHRLEL